MATATAPSETTQSIDWRLARKYIAYYKNYLVFEDKEPTIVAWYDIGMRYGGPEEGNWYYESGWPVKQVCVFNKKQAIREAIKLHEEAIEEYGEERDYLGWNMFSIDYKTQWAQPYPTERPYYC